MATDISAHMNVLITPIPRERTIELQYRVSVAFKPGKCLGLGAIQSLRNVSHSGSGSGRGNKHSNPIEKSRKSGKSLQNKRKLQESSIVTKSDAYVFAFHHALAEARHFYEEKRGGPNAADLPHMRIYLDFEPTVDQLDDFFSLTQRSERSDSNSQTTGPARRQEITGKLKNEHERNERVLLKQVWRKLRWLEERDVHVAVQYVAAAEDGEMVKARAEARHRGNKCKRRLRRQSQTMKP